MTAKLAEDIGMLIAMMMIRPDPLVWQHEGIGMIPERICRGELLTEEEFASDKKARIRLHESMFFRCPPYVQGIPKRAVKKAYRDGLIAVSKHADGQWELAVTEKGLEAADFEFADFYAEHHKESLQKLQRRWKTE